MPLRPTALGLKAVLFYVMLGLAFYAAPYTNLFFLLLAFLSVLGLLGGLWAWRNLRAVHAEILAIEPAPAGTGHEVLVHLSPDRARYQLQVRVQIQGRWHEVLDLPAVHGATTEHGRLQGLPRGLHRIERAELCSQYPFGLVCCGRKIACPDVAVAFPVPADLPECSDHGSLLATLKGALPFATDDLSPSHFRQFRDGDALRAVHWKATARRDSLIVLEREGHGGDSWEVVIDRRGDDAQLERCLGVATALLLLAREQKEPLTLTAQDHRATYGPNHAPFAAALTWLAAADPLPSDAAPPPPSSPTVLHLPRDLRREGLGEVAHG